MKEGNKITHPEILRTEKFGSREGGCFDNRCCVCKKECQDNFLVNVVGKLFCSTECMEKRRGWR